MSQGDIINTLTEIVKTELSDAEGGHDWWHTYRVWKVAKRLAIEEGADRFVVELAALLHDIADAKFHDGDETVGPTRAKDILEGLGVDTAIIKHVIKIIRYMSFKNSFDVQNFDSLEMRILQDADRLDAMGAIGIARAFNYGGFKNRALYDPASKPDLQMTKVAYKTSQAPTINHFYEKLLLLKDRMHTKTGKRLAQKRHAFMLLYLDQFYSEWNVGDVPDGSSGRKV